MSDLIQRHLEQLIGLFTRINPPVDLNSLRILHGKGDLAGMTQWTCDFMALGINIGVKPAGSGAPVIEQAPMWVEARSSLPRIGTPEFSSSHANICFHPGTIEELPFELIVAGIAQALARLVLHSMQHHLQRDGKAIDLTAMIFGFRGFGESEIGFDEADIREMVFSSTMTMPIPRLVHFGFLTGLEAIFAQRWLAANRERVERENTPAFDLADRLKKMQYVDDAIVLINKLGGTVAIEQRGRFFRKEIQKVVLSGRLYEFKSLHEMTQWVIANVASTVKNESGPSPVSRSILRS